MPKNVFITDMKYEKVISYAGRQILTEIVDSSVLEVIYFYSFISVHFC